MPNSLRRLHFDSFGVLLSALDSGFSACRVPRPPNILEDVKAPKNVLQDSENIDELESGLVVIVDRVPSDHSGRGKEKEK